MPSSKQPESFNLLNFFTQDNPFLQLTIDTLPVPIFYKDLHGIYLGCNSAFEDFIKIPKEQLIGHSVYDLFDKDLADVYQMADQELFDNPGVQTYEKQILTNENEPVFVKFHKTSFCDDKGKVAGVIGVIFDITKQKSLEEKLISNATFDSLTGLYNRRQGTRIAVEKMKQAIQGEIEYAVIMVDIDYFKRVNDQFGHAMGDKALKHFSTIIRQLKQPEETLIRWGGEEFLILVSAPIGTTDFKMNMLQRANFLREAICSSPFKLKDDLLTLTISCGVSCHQNQTLRELIDEADALLYKAKDKGRNRVCG